MCLITEKLPEILKKNLKVYKLVNPSLTSIYENYQYSLGVLCPTEELIANCEEEYFFANNTTNEYYAGGHNADEVRTNPAKFNLFGYSRGYHFYISEVEALKSTYSYKVLIECIVPKGSTIVYDSTGLGVASSIKLTKIINHVPKY